jgi:hypothetical protein
VDEQVRPLLKAGGPDLDGLLTPRRRSVLKVRRTEETSMDFIYVVGVLAFLALSWGLVRLCEKVG